MTERAIGSIILVKPDMLSRGLVEELKKKIRENGLKIIAFGELMMDLNFVKTFYRWENVYHPCEIDEYLCRLPLLIWLISGEGAILKLIGIKREMRKQYCSDCLHSLFHCPDNEEEFEREKKLIISRIGVESMKTNNQVEVIVFKKENGNILFLLLKRSSKKGGFWQPITGNVRVDETFENAALRELKEETEIASIKRIMDTGFSFEFFDDNRQQHEKVFGVEVATDTKVIISAEHTEFVWVTAEKALNEYLKYPGNKKGIEALQKKIEEGKND
jgi:dATP pyrophosphohydrolase